MLWDALGQEDTMGLQLPRAQSQISVPVPQFQELFWLHLEPSLSFSGPSFTPRAAAELQQCHPSFTGTQGDV